MSSVYWDSVFFKYYFAEWKIQCFTIAVQFVSNIQGLCVIYQRKKVKGFMCNHVLHL